MGNSLASPTESMVKEVSGLLAEPEEISRERSVALDYFNKLPIEKSQLYTKYVDILSGLNLDSIQLGLPSNSRTIPSEISHLIREKDEPTLALQVDSQMVRTEVHGALEKEGNRLLRLGIGLGQVSRPRPKPVHKSNPAGRQQ